MVSKRSNFEDIEKYLADYTEDSYPIGEIRQSTCSCGNTAFYLEYDEDEGVAKRTCSKCEKEHFICDSEEFWSDAEPQKLVCECKGKLVEIGVGFSISDNPERGIKWITVGTRCVNCGIMGVPVEWKIDYSPNLFLMDQV